MIIGLAWDKMTPGVQAQVVRDVLALGEDLTAVYWTGVELDSTLRVLGVKRCLGKQDVEVWRTYQVGDKEVRPPTNVEAIPCVLYRGKTNTTLRPNVKRVRKAEEQGIPNTFNPYDVPMPDPYGRAVDPRVLLLWT